MTNPRVSTSRTVSVREQKKAMARGLKEERRKKAEIERACFWTWPWGHIYSTSALCSVCGHFGSRSSSGGYG